MYKLKRVFTLAVFCCTTLISYTQNTYIVDSTSDTSDATPGDGICDDGTGVCTFRAAIEESNADGVASNIHFNIAGTAPHVINVTIPYDIVSDSLIIDGSTQPSWVVGDIIINGPYPSSTVNGINIAASEVEIYGLRVNQFFRGIFGGFSFNVNNIRIGDLTKENIITNSFVGIHFEGCEELEIKNNYIGTDENLSFGLLNERGVYIDADSYIINNITSNIIMCNGNNLGDGNGFEHSLTCKEGSFIIKNNVFCSDFSLISRVLRSIRLESTINTTVENNIDISNAFQYILAYNVENTVIKGNHLGYDPTGLYVHLADISPYNTGIWVNDGLNTVIDSNTIIPASSYGTLGIFLDCSDSTDVVQNIIGSNPTSIGSLSRAMQIIGCDNGLVFNNKFSRGSSDGISVTFSNAMKISQNSFHCNSEGIFTTSDGTPPLITEINSLSIEGNAQPSDSIELFINVDTSCILTNCQGSVYLGTAFTDVSGNWSMPTPSTLKGGDKITATATDPNGNTSIFADCYTILENDCPLAKSIDLNLDPCNENGTVTDMKALSASSFAHASSCGGDLPNSLVDAWYTLIVPPSGNFLLRANSDNTIAPVIEAYTGTCGALSQLTCQSIDTVPYAMIFENYTPGTEIIFSVWDVSNTIVNSTGPATLSLSAHVLSNNPNDWTICDFETALIVGNPTNLASREVSSYILEFEENTPIDSVLAWEQEAILLGDNLVDECVCGGRTIQLWGVNNPIINLEERRKTTKTKAKVDTSNYNFIFEDIEFQVNTYSSGEQEKGAVAMDNDGNFAMAWIDEHREHNYGRMYNNSGNPISDEFQIGVTNAEQYSNDIGIRSDGSYMITWDERDLSTNSTTEIYARSYDSDGTPSGSIFSVSSLAAQNISNNIDTLNKYTPGLNPKISIANDDSFLILWNNSSNIYFQQYDSSNNLVGTIQKVNTAGNSSTSPNVSLAMNSVGEFVIAWNGQGSGQDVYFQRYDNLGNKVGNTIIPHLYTQDDQTNPSVALADNGLLTIAWQSFDQDNDKNGVYWQQFDAMNNPQFTFSGIGIEIKANTNTCEEQLTPSIGLLENDNVIITWSSYHEQGTSCPPPASNGTEENIYYRIFDSNGNAFNPEDSIVNQIKTFQQLNPKVATDGKGLFITAWEDRNNDGSYKGIFAQRFEVLSDGNTITDVYPIGTATPSSLLGDTLIYPQTIYQPTDSISNVRVAVIDTGVEDIHSYLSGAIWNNQEVNDGDNCQIGDIIGYDFVSEDGNPDDGDGHGTRVNGIISRDFDDNLQLELMNLKFHDQSKGTVFDAVCAIYYAVDNGANVLNLSWGFEASENPAVLRDALLYAAANDVLIVTTAGNTSKNNDVINKYPANLDIPTMIVVTSYTLDNGQIELSNYASYGATNVDIAAHGFVQTPSLGNTLELSAGTSLAAPSVTRTAATIKGLFPQLTALEIKGCILDEANTDTNLNGLVAMNRVLNHQAAIECARIKAGDCIAIDLYISNPQSIDSIYRSDAYIGSDATLSASVDLEYLAADSILLDENFCVPLGAEFLADIEDCDPLNNFTGSENEAVFRIQEHSPNSGKIKAKFQAKVGEEVTIRVLDANRKLLNEWNSIIPKEGTFEKVVDIHRLPAGIYYINYQSGDWDIEKAVQIE